MRFRTTKGLEYMSICGTAVQRSISRDVYAFAQRDPLRQPRQARGEVPRTIRSSRACGACLRGRHRHTRCPSSIDTPMNSFIFWGIALLVVTVWEYQSEKTNTLFLFKWWLRYDISKYKYPWLYWFVLMVQTVGGIFLILHGIKAG